MSDTSAERRFAASMGKVAKWIYWIVGLLVIGAISYFFYNVMGRQITGVLFFGAGIVVLYFYYVKWFLVPEKKPDWVPYQTPCPDYLTVLAGAGGAAPGGAYKCVDFVGVSRRADGLKKIDPRNLASQQNNPQYYFLVDPAEDRESLRQRVMAQGLTWNSLFGDN